MLRIALTAAFVLVVLAGCHTADRFSDYHVASVALPEGHPDTGRRVFLRMGCASCHEVAWETELPHAASFYAGPALDRRLSRMTAGQLVTAVAAPSYRVAPEYRGRTEGGVSPMADFTGSMTVRELVDVVAYLRTQGGRVDSRADPPFDPGTLPHHM